MNKKSITIIGKPVKYVYILKDIDVDKITMEKYDVDCRNRIDSAWQTAGESITLSERTLLNEGEQILEIVLKDKISNITLTGRAAAIEIASKNSGKIVKDIKVGRTKKGKKVYLEDIEFFKEATI